MFEAGGGVCGRKDREGVFERCLECFERTGL
jgi:hypothetical protein